jgi:hypothetical protein
MNEQIIQSSEALEAVTRSEIDLAISTAKRFPREIERVKNEILSCATSSRETAESCFYHLPRSGKTIEGPSVRLAEIINYCWGNINSGFRIVANDGKKITAQAVAHDLERNNRVMAEVSRRITDSHDKLYTQDMQIMTGNAAGSIAWRNVIFKLIPNAVWIDIHDKIKLFIVGGAKKDDKEFLKRRVSLLERFAELGASEKDVCKLMKVNSAKDLDMDKCFKLYGVLTAIKEETTSVEEVFGIAPAKNETQDFGDDKPEEAKEIKDELELK